MTQTIELEVIRRLQALSDFEAICRKDITRRWPQINFDADDWPIHSTYKTKMLDVRFTASKEAFEKSHPSYMIALRCLIARAALEGRIKESGYLIAAWRILADQSKPLGNLRRLDLNQLEESIVANATTSSAGMARGHLQALSRLLADLGKIGVVDRLAWSPSIETRTALQKLHQRRQTEFKSQKQELLDSQIAAFSEATSAMLKGDERLDGYDLSAIAATNILMCAPSRINEPLNLKVGDRFAVEAYAQRSEDRERDALHSTHQLLLLKGSKGAQWAPKPILNFMIGLCDTCWKILLDQGARSRMLVTWYEQHPDRLFLPSELEHLRDKPVSHRALCQIINLTANEVTASQLRSVKATAWKLMTTPNGNQNPIKIVEIINPTEFRKDGRRNNANPIIQALPWNEVEAYLLKRVHERMNRMRKLTKGSYYKGKLSEMLMLVDSASAPYLPQALDDVAIRSRLKTKASDIRDQRQPSVFIKLGLKMVQEGKEVDCYLEPHDLRRWLTTQALLARERVSDVLINKWANRLDISQLAAYDLRTSEQKSEQTNVPIPRELYDISRGLQELESIESKYGLRTEMVVVNNETITVTSIEAVYSATEDRPIARTSNQIIILYPTRFGVCLHQHHEVPCRSYECGSGCNEQIAIKGHLPTNDEWRKESDLTSRGIINQLQALIIAKNREIADEPNTLDAHLLKLVNEGLDPTSMANDLIDRFHEIKNLIRDTHFKHELEHAFVARGIVKRLDDPHIPSGSIIKYHNPQRHASPGLERAIEVQHGSRDLMHIQSKEFYKENPEMAPRRLDLQDESHLLEGNHDQEKDNDSDKQYA